MSSISERKVSTLNSAEGKCEDVIEFEHKNKEGEVTYKGQKLILQVESQYFEIEAKADEDMPMPDQNIVVQWWCNGRRCRNSDDQDWMYFTSLKLRKWEPIEESKQSDGSVPF